MMLNLDQPDSRAEGPVEDGGGTEHAFVICESREPPGAALVVDGEPSQIPCEHEDPLVLLEALPVNAVIHCEPR